MEIPRPAMEVENLNVAISRRLPISFTIWSALPAVAAELALYRASTRPMKVSNSPTPTK